MSNSTNPAISAAERVHWAQRDLEQAVRLMKLQPLDATFHRAVIGRFNDLETARAAQRRADAKQQIQSRCHVCGRANREGT